MNYWLMKSEPETYSIDDLSSQPRKTDYWDGIRNYQARNFMRDEFKKNDIAFFYHSNCKVPGIVGIMKVVKTAYPDDTALNPSSSYFDPKSTPENPRWYRVDVKFVTKFPEIISLQSLKNNPKLSKMRVIQKGCRLSITPVTYLEYKEINRMAGYMP
jgi:predicted RNA-binding protein with PUA-like domain